jgi:hypothetical protein
MSWCAQDLQHSTAQHGTEQHGKGWWGGYTQCNPGVGLVSETWAGQWILAKVDVSSFIAGKH